MGLLWVGDVVPDQVTFNHTIECPPIRPAPQQHLPVLGAACSGPPPPPRWVLGSVRADFRLRPPLSPRPPPLPNTDVSYMRLRTWRRYALVLALVLASVPGVDASAKLGRGGGTPQSSTKGGDPSPEAYLKFTLQQLPINDPSPGEIEL